VVARGPYIADGVVGKNVSAIQLRHCSAVRNDTADNGVALIRASAMAVFEDGIDRSETWRWISRARMHAFAISPAVIPAFLNDIELFPGVLANITAIHHACV